jgi:hypothetical protein
VTPAKERQRLIGGLLAAVDRRTHFEPIQPVLNADFVRLALGLEGRLGELSATTVERLRVTPVSGLVQPPSSARSGFLAVLAIALCSTRSRLQLDVKVGGASIVPSSRYAASRAPEVGSPGASSLPYSSHRHRERQASLGFCCHG